MDNDCGVNLMNFTLDIDVNIDVDRDGNGHLVGGSAAVMSHARHVLDETVFCPAPLAPFGGPSRHVLDETVLCDAPLAVVPPSFEGGDPDTSVNSIDHEDEEDEENQVAEQNEESAHECPPTLNSSEKSSDPPTVEAGLVPEVPQPREESVNVSASSNHDLDSSAKSEVHSISGGTKRPSQDYNEANLPENPAIHEDEENQEMETSVIPMEISYYKDPMAEPEQQPDDLMGFGSDIESKMFEPSIDDKENVSMNVSEKQAVYTKPVIAARSLLDSTCITVSPPKRVAAEQSSRFTLNDSCFNETTLSSKSLPIESFLASSYDERYNLEKTGYSCGDESVSMVFEKTGLGCKTIDESHHFRRVEPDSNCGKEESTEDTTVHEVVEPVSVVAEKSIPIPDVSDVPIEMPPSDVEESVCTKDPIENSYIPEATLPPANETEIPEVKEQSHCEENKDENIGGDLTDPTESVHEPEPEVEVVCVEDQIFEDQHHEPEVEKSICNTEPEPELQNEVVSDDNQIIEDQPPITKDESIAVESDPKVDPQSPDEEKEEAQKPEEIVKEADARRKSDEAREQFRMEFVIKQLKRSELLLAALSSERDQLVEQVTQLRGQSEKQGEEMREYVEKYRQAKMEVRSERMKAESVSNQWRFYRNSKKQSEKKVQNIASDIDVFLSSENLSTISMRDFIVRIKRKLIEDYDDTEEIDDADETEQ